MAEREGIAVDPVINEYIDRLRICGVRPDHAWAVVTSFMREGDREGLERYVKDCEVGFLCG